MLLTILLYVLELVSSWFLFKKYNEPGWKGIIPVYSDYVEFGKIWSAPIGIVYGLLSLLSSLDLDIGTLLTFVIGIACLVIGIMFAIKKAKAFGKGIGMILLLIFIPFVGNLILAFGKAQFNETK